MNHAQRLTSRLLLAVGALAAIGCGGSEDTTTGGDCRPDPVEKCVARDDAWLATLDGPGGAGGSGGEGGGAATPDRCPTADDMPSVNLFLRRVGFPSSSLISARTEGAQCCYTAPRNECVGGRPFVVAGALRTARLGGESGWG
ncbi:MAG: hypothetical protein EOO75_09140 [Myxococcales bacterium]|nr:MAG: hypothetical protein EOO75_09140 [Myxococcales bacterium]